MKTKANAMVFEEVGTPFSSARFDLPELKAGEVLVRTTYATICTSDLHTYYGRRQSCRHSILGHEIIGEVIKTAAGGVMDYYGTPLKTGDRITWSVYAYDPNTITARKGYPQKAEGLYKYGHEQISDRYQLNGGFSSHCHLRKGTAIFQLPKSLNPREAAPLNCTHATIAGAIRLAGDLSEKNLLISGVGMLGLSACAMAKEKGARQVWAQDIDPEKSRFAATFGADGTLVFGQEGLQASINKYGRPDVIIETSGSPEAVENCLQLLGIGGTIILVGSVFPQRDLAVNAEHLVRNLLTIKGLHNYIPEDLAEAITFIAKTSKKYPFSKLVGTEYSLGELDQAFSTGNQGIYYRIGIIPE